MSESTVRQRKSVSPAEEGGATSSSSADDNLDESTTLGNVVPLIAMVILFPLFLLGVSYFMTGTFTFGLTWAHIENPSLLWEPPQKFGKTQGVQASKPRTAGQSQKSNDAQPAKRRIAEKLKVFTVKELAKYDGETDDTPVFLAIKGRVYDVTEGRRHYGKGGGYHFFAGKDASRSFVTGCFDEACFEKQPPGLNGLTDKQLDEVDNWVKTYDEKYKFVGFLKGYYELYDYPEVELLPAKSSNKQRG